MCKSARGNGSRFFVSKGGDRMDWNKLKDRLHELWRQGKKDGEIAESLGLSRSTVCRLRKKLGLSPRARGRPPGAGDRVPRERRSERERTDMMYRRPGRPVSPNAKFGIKNEDMPQLCRSAYKLQADGSYKLIEPWDKPVGMPKLVRKIVNIGA
jgi:AraC-like DNA-binding protein